LFAWLLRSLGFEVAMIAAGVANDRGGFGPDFDHMALRVSLAERWLVDVGFGDSFLEPLLLDERIDQRQGDQSFRIVPDNSHLIVKRRNHGEEWQPQYRFTLQAHNYEEYEEMCHYHQTSPESHFTKSRICSLATPDGRITLSAMRLITTSNQDRHERTLTDDEYMDVLKDQFGIVMNRGITEVG
jgi:N-hydroxyarylamine O-acetyltransferase